MDVMQSLQAKDVEATKARSWALLPQVGYSPEKGLNAGLKYTDRDLFTSGLTLDLSAAVATEGQQNYSLMLIQPNLWQGKLLTIWETAFSWIPLRSFSALATTISVPMRFRLMNSDQLAARRRLLGVCGRSFRSPLGSGFGAQMSPMATLATILRYRSRRASFPI